VDKGNYLITLQVKLQDWKTTISHHLATNHLPRGKMSRHFSRAAISRGDASAVQKLLFPSRSRQISFAASSGNPLDRMAFRSQAGKTILNPAARQGRYHLPQSVPRDTAFYIFPTKPPA
jgi:hypothetical protein